MAGEIAGAGAAPAPAGGLGANGDGGSASDLDPFTAAILAKRWTDEVTELAGLRKRITEILAGEVAA
jgi:hypothetical protein